MGQHQTPAHSQDVSMRSSSRMRLPAVRPLSLVIVESGSCWPDGFERTHGADCLVVAEQLDEAPTTFAERVVQRLRALQSSAATVSKVTFAAGHACGSDRRRCRSTIARALFEASLLATRASIDFVAHATLNEEARHELLAFAGTLLEQVGYDPPAINVKFAAHESPASGVRQAVPTHDGETLDNVA